MKRSILLLSALTLWTLNGCVGTQGLLVYDVDPGLKKIEHVRALTTMNSVGFEWDAIEEKHIHGVNIYRGTPSNRTNQGFKRIGTVGSKYATHFVDTHVKPGQQYLYTFTTFSYGSESKHGAILKVKTPPVFKGVSFVKSFRVARSVVKLLWRPVEREIVSGYFIERSVNGSNWKYLAKVDGRLSAEYVDTFVRAGSRYAYRVTAKGYNNLKSAASPATRISLFK